MPRFLLAGFTDAGGYLFVHDLRRRRDPWRVRPEKTGHQRDFYRVEVPGEAPTLVEDALAEMETAAAPLIRQIVDTWSLPTGVERETLLWFIATLAARVPRQRAEISRFVVDLSKLRLEAAISTPARFERYIQRLRDRGVDVSDFSREELLEALNDPAIKCEVNQTWAIGQMFEIVKTLAPLVVARQWCVLVAEPDAPDFICSDNPVSLVLRHPSPDRWCGIGWAMPDTCAIVPISKRIALYGLLDVKLPQHLSVSTRTVATMNTATLACAQKHVYSAIRDFIWTRADGHLGHTCDLPELGEPRE